MILKGSRNETQAAFFAVLLVKSDSVWNKDMLK